MKSTHLFKISFPYDVTSFDPRKNSNYINSTAHFMLFSGLTQMSPNKEIELALADSLKISEDKKVYTFFLKKSFWSDGSLVTADDFVFAWQTLLDPKFPAPNAHLFYPIKNSEAVKKGVVSKNELGVKALDSRTLEVTLNAPTPYFLELTSFCPFFPVPSHIVKNNPAWADTLSSSFVTNGPFLLKKLNFKSDYLFEKNPLYFDVENVHLDQIEVIIIDNEMTALALFKNKELDFYGAYSPIPADSIPQLKKENELHIQPVGATSFLSYNLLHPILKNKNIRKALSLSIDRKSLVDNITLCNEVAATDIIPPILRNFSTSNLIEDYDSKIAKEYLEKGLNELGISKKELSSLTLFYSQNTNYRRICQALQETWQKSLDVFIKLEELEFKVLQEKFALKDYSIGLSAWVVQYNDCMNVLDRFKEKNNHYNYPGFDNSLYIDLLNLSPYSSSKEERTTILEKAEQILADETPLTPLYHLNCIYLKQNYVDGLYISPIGSLHFNHISLREKQ